VQSPSPSAIQLYTRERTIAIRCYKNIMGYCFSSPSKPYRNRSSVVARYEVVPSCKAMDKHPAASPDADRLLVTGDYCELVKRKPLPQQPLPIATHQNLQHLPQEQLRVDAFYNAPQALSADAVGPSRSRGRDLGLRVTTVPYSGQTMEPGNVSPVSVESISTQGGTKIRRMATTSRIRKKYELPPRRRRVEMGVEEAIRE